MAGRLAEQKKKGTVGEHFEKLREMAGRVFDLASASDLLSWDMQTYMPPGGADGRALAMATLASLPTSSLSEMISAKRWKQRNRRSRTWTLIQTKQESLHASDAISTRPGVFPAIGSRYRYEPWVLPLTHG